MSSADRSQTPVSMTIYDVLHDPDFYIDPYKFSPERWLEDPQLDRYFVAFGRGTRMCQGMR